jgi:hypothetical protein
MNCKKVREMLLTNIQPYFRMNASRRKVKMNKGVLLAASLWAILSSMPALADQHNLFALVDSKPISETWLNAGFYSYHFQRNKGLNDRNPGLGIEYRYSTVASVTAGRFYNSDRAYSNYAGVYYQPWAIGPVRLGAVMGGFSGYPKMRNGGWFLAAVPVASIENSRVGVNIGFVPSYKDRLYGALSFQLKLKL